jgi:hypothetical protein
MVEAEEIKTKLLANQFIETQEKINSLTQICEQVTKYKQRNYVVYDFLETELIEKISKLVRKRLEIINAIKANLQS